MDLLRTTLGEQQVSYYGASYGTLLGATYATLFPERVRHMVLDSPVHPTSWQQRPLPALTEQAASGEQVLDAYFAACVRGRPRLPVRCRVPRRGVRRAGGPAGGRAAHRCRCLGRSRHTTAKPPRRNE